MAFGDIPALLRAFLVTALMVPFAAPASAQEAAPETAAQTQRGLGTLRSGSEALADLAGELIHAVVNISTSQMVGGARAIPTPELPEGSPYKEFFEEFFERHRRGGGLRKVRSLGSGFVVDPDGIIVTNNHVIADGDKIIVNFSDGTKLDAEVIGRDPTTDIAVLRVKPDRRLSAVGFGDSDRLRIGNWVVAIGNPFGLGSSVTIGIVSARNRDIHAGPYDDFIQTDAAINRGNSGGPLFNLDGEVIGINTAIFSPTGGSIGIGFAVPASLARPVVEQLITHGEVRRGWLGVNIQRIEDEDADRPPPRGAVVVDVNPAGPAAAAGLRPGDVVTRFAGGEVGGLRDLARAVAGAQPGDEVELSVLREGREVRLRVTVGRLQGEEDAVGEGGAAADGARLLGFKVVAMSDELREQYAIAESVNGVVVSDVDPDSDAAGRGIAPGTVIVQLNHQPVGTPAELVAAVEALRGEGRDWVLLTVAEPTGDLRLVALGTGD